MNASSGFDLSQSRMMFHQKVEQLQEEIRSRVAVRSASRSPSPGMHHPAGDQHMFGQNDGMHLGESRQPHQPQQQHVEVMFGNNAPSYSPPQQQSFPPPLPHHHQPHQQSAVNQQSNSSTSVMAVPDNQVYSRSMLRQPQHSPQPVYQQRSQSQSQSPPFNSGVTPSRLQASTSPSHSGTTPLHGYTPNRGNSGWSPSYSVGREPSVGVAVHQTGKTPQRYPKGLEEELMGDLPAPPSCAGQFARESYSANSSYNVNSAQNSMNSTHLTAPSVLESRPAPPQQQLTPSVALGFLRHQEEQLMQRDHHQQSRSPEAHCPTMAPTQQHGFQSHHGDRGGTSPPLYPPAALPESIVGGEQSSSLPRQRSSLVAPRQPSAHSSLHDQSYLEQQVQGYRSFSNHASLSPQPQQCADVYPPPLMQHPPSASRNEDHVVIPKEHLQAPPGFGEAQAPPGFERSGRSYSSHRQEQGGNHSNVCHDIDDEYHNAVARSNQRHQSRSSQREQPTTMRRSQSSVSRSPGRSMDRAGRHTTDPEERARRRAIVMQYRMMDQALNGKPNWERSLRGAKSGAAPGGAKTVVSPQAIFSKAVKRVQQAESPGPGHRMSPKRVSPVAGRGRRDQDRSATPTNLKQQRAAVQQRSASATSATTPTQPRGHRMLNPTKMADQYRSTSTLRSPSATTKKVTTPAAARAPSLATTKRTRTAANAPAPSASTTNRVATNTKRFVLKSPAVLVKDTHQQRVNHSVSSSRKLGKSPGSGKKNRNVPKETRSASPRTFETNPSQFASPPSGSRAQPVSPSQALFQRPQYNDDDGMDLTQRFVAEGGMDAEYNELQRQEAHRQYFTDSHHQQNVQGQREQQHYEHHRQEDEEEGHSSMIEAAVRHAQYPPPLGNTVAERPEVNRPRYVDPQHQEQQHYHQQQRQHYQQAPGSVAGSGFYRDNERSNSGGPHRMHHAAASNMAINTKLDSAQYYNALHDATNHQHGAKDGGSSPLFSKQVEVTEQEHRDAQQWRFKRSQSRELAHSIMAAGSGEREASVPQLSPRQEHPSTAAAARSPSPLARKNTMPYGSSFGSNSFATNVGSFSSNSFAYKPEPQPPIAGSMKGGYEEPDAGQMDALMASIQRMKVAMSH